MDILHGFRHVNTQKIFTSNRVARISHRAKRVPIFLKLCTGSNCWAFVGVRQKREKHWIAFCGVYAIFIKGTFQCFLRVNEFLHPPIWQKFWYCLFLYDQTNRHATENSEKTPLKTAKFSILFCVLPANC